MNFKIVRLCVLVITIFCSTHINVQAQEYTGAWHTVVLKHNLNSKFMLSNEIHVRRTQFYKDWQQFLLRPAVTYKLNQNVKFAAGYTYIINYTADDNAIEHNVWEDIILSNSVKKLGISHRFRFEQRFAQAFHSEDFDHVNRLRYRITLKRNLFKVKEDKTISATVFNEIWLNTGSGLQPETINQNWVYAGLNYPLSPKILVSMGYLHMNLPQNAGDAIKHNILQISASVKI